MFPLLEHAIAMASKLPEADQESIAVLILEEIEEDRKWEESFARSPENLKAIAERAVEQVRAGRFRATGFDEL